MTDDNATYRTIQFDQGQATRLDTLEMAVELAAVAMQHRNLPASEVGQFLATTHAGMLALIAPPPAEPKPEPLKPRDDALGDILGSSPT